jgi:hypothetical protein
LNCNTFVLCCGFYGCTHLSNCAFKHLLNCKHEYDKNICYTCIYCRLNMFMLSFGALTNYTTVIGNLPYTFSSAGNWFCLIEVLLQTRSLTGVHVYYVLGRRVARSLGVFSTAIHVEQLTVSTQLVCWSNTLQIKSICAWPSYNLLGGSFNTSNSASSLLTFTSTTASSAGHWVQLEFPKFVKIASVALKRISNESDAPGLLVVAGH